MDRISTHAPLTKPRGFANRRHRAVTVSGNWRVTFRFGDGNAVDVDYLDYH